VTAEAFAGTRLIEDIKEDYSAVGEVLIRSNFPLEVVADGDVLYILLVGRSDERERCLQYVRSRYSFMGCHSATGRGRVSCTMLTTGCLQCRQ
jgi:hypothetical protein